jgi:hypothetical protein
MKRRLFIVSLILALLVLAGIGLMLKLGRAAATRGRSGLARGRSAHTRAGNKPLVPGV